jgi:UDP-N-acetylmuramoyl-tripeptide--D-alanyl-D-alanine ligase
VVRFGRMSADADVRAVDVEVDHELRARFTLETPWGRRPVELGVRGEHQVGNGLAAAAAALVAGVPIDAVTTGLATEAVSPWRMHLVRAPSGLVVLNDAYNANPTSMAAALRALAALPARRRVAVVGLMAELGAVAAAEHHRVAALAGSLGLELLAVGTDLYGVEPVATMEDALAALDGIGEGDAVLVKGSRVAGLERLAESLTDESAARS